MIQWFKPDRTLIQLSVVNVVLLLRARKKHISAPFVTRIIVVAFGSCLRLLSVWMEALAFVIFFGECG